MFVTDVKCSQAAWQTVPNSRTGSCKASVSEAVVRTWDRAHVVKGRPDGPSVAFRDEMDIISQVGRTLPPSTSTGPWTACVAQPVISTVTAVIHSLQRLQTSDRIAAH